MGQVLQPPDLDKAFRQHLIFREAVSAQGVSPPDFPGRLDLEPGRCGLSPRLPQTSVIAPAVTTATGLDCLRVLKCSFQLQAAEDGAPGLCHPRCRVQCAGTAFGPRRPKRSFVTAMKGKPWSGGGELKTGLDLTALAAAPLKTGCKSLSVLFSLEKRSLSLNCSCAAYSCQTIRRDQLEPEGT
ncbi:hypothetical protein AAFF_G00141280 [Aldrovandia affinis]|uniref:Uncharacterized protein n=1 Tax=Aldrovandia affinis TaxID=143900 RepID=A0AAD7TCH3_9TELE|nr:hypothetical protein AAFF_G00141280 [Aldrovandia affinis]